MSSLFTKKMESVKCAPVSSASQGMTTDSSQSSEGNYAFLIHSKDSGSQKTPPDIINQHFDKHLVRQKRRRTRYLLSNIKKTMFVD